MRSAIELLAACLACCPSCSSQPSGPGAIEPGATYYVTLDGDDNNAGTRSAPWRTIQHAASILGPGETVLIRTGIYAERVVPTNSGRPGAYITYAAYPGDSVTLDGSSIDLPSTWGGLFDITGRSFIRVSGLRVINAGPFQNNVGILVYQSSHVVVEQNATYNTVSSGIASWNSQYVSIRDNDVQLCCNDGLGECITISGTDSFEVSQNRVHDGGPGTNGGEGIDVKNGSSNGTVFKNSVYNLNTMGIYVDAWDTHTFNILVYQNTVDSCLNGFGVASEAGGPLENVYLFDNISYGNKQVGIVIGWASKPGPVSSVMVINNTVYSNGVGAWGGGIDIQNPRASNIVVRNNIASSNLSFQVAVDSASAGIIDHNLIDGFRGYIGETFGQDSLIGDPLFVAPANGDFHLQQRSPGIDHGSSTNAPAMDFDGVSRPQGAGYDIGAFERPSL